MNSYELSRLIEAMSCQAALQVSLGGFTGVHHSINIAATPAINPKKHRTLTTSRKALG